MRVAYVGPAQESENFGIFSPGPAAYSPRVMSAQANTQQRPPIRCASEDSVWRVCILTTSWKESVVSSQ